MILGNQMRPSQLLEDLPHPTVQQPRTSLTTVYFDKLIHTLKGTFLIAAQAW